MQHSSSLISDELRDATYALVISSIDYCNLLYLNLPKVLIRRLQMLVNAAARVISSCSRFRHITDLVRDDLHWLPVKQRIQFKASTLVYTSLYNCSPAYIKNLISHSILTTRGPGLRLSLRQTLIVPRCRTMFVE